MSAEDIPSAEAIPGWMDAAELRWLADAAAQMGSVAEIGCWKGRSTYALLTACPGLVYAVDHWRGSEGERETTHREAAEDSILPQFLKNVGHLRNLRICSRHSVDAARIVPSVDMVFLDAGHGYDDVFRDLVAWTPKARRLLCGHDIDEPDVLRAVRELIGEPRRGPGSIWFTWKV